MFSTFHRVCPAKIILQNKRAFIFCSVSTHSIRQFPKYPIFVGLKVRYDIPNKIKILTREFHTTKRRDIPPLLALILRPVLHIGSFIFGRTLRKWWARIDPYKRKQYAAWIQSKKSYFYGILGGTLSILFIYYCTHIENAPITGRPRFIMFTKEQQATFAKLTFEMHLEQHKDHILSTNHPIYNKLLTVTNRLLNANKDLEYVKDKHWTLSVIDLPAQNAYVLPGGNIFVFTGALQMVENDDQLSFVIAHEMAHAILKHSIEQVSSGFIVDILLVLPIIMIWAIFPDLAAGFLQFMIRQIINILHHLPYSRALENEADEVGLMLAARACVDVREAVVFWRLMQALKDLTSEPVEIAWLSTHPNHKDRETNLNEQMSKAIALRNSKQCPLLDPIDPRKKFYSAKELEARFKLRGIL